jgi:uncharacterized protein YkwD
LALAAALFACGAFLGQTAISAPLNAANFDRMQGCGGSRERKPLLYSARLSSAAKELADGVSLQRAIANSGYLAAKSTELHLSGVAGDAEIQHALAARYCQTLQDPQLQDFGAVQRGREVWMVLAARAFLPAARDATTVAHEILEGVNAARAGGHRCGARYFKPAAPLALDGSLTRAALAHSTDMAAHDRFDHQGSDGSLPALRVDRAGFGGHRIVGENIAAGAMTASEVTQGWLASPPHCANIMDRRFTLVGIAFAENLHTRSTVFWTQDFAAH